MKQKFFLQQLSCLTKMRKIYLISMLLGSLLSTGLAYAGEIGECDFSLAHEGFVNGIVSHVNSSKIKWELKGGTASFGKNAAILKVKVDDGSVETEVTPDKIKMDVGFQEIGGYQQSYLKSFTVQKIQIPNFGIIDMKFTKKLVLSKNGKSVNLMRADLSYEKNEMSYYSKQFGEASSRFDRFFVMTDRGGCTVNYYTHDDNNVEHHGRIIEPVSTIHYAYEPVDK